MATTLDVNGKALKRERGRIPRSWVLEMNWA
jgi:hypothetical protein